MFTLPQKYQKHSGFIRNQT